MLMDRYAEMMNEARPRGSGMIPKARLFGWVTWVLMIGGSLLIAFTTGHLSTLGLVAWGLGLFGQVTAGFALHRRGARTH
jgi:hypothetical protein